MPKIMVSVPKRKFKLAVNRNLLKRKIREAYRLNKHLLSDEKLDRSYNFVFLFVSNKIESQETINESMKTILTHHLFINE